MLKKLLTVLVALFAVAAFAAVDVNKATQAELESVKGIGPDIAARSSTSARRAPSRTGPIWSTASRAWAKATPRSSRPRA